MRRGGKLRLLTLYYCILVLDRANDRQSNPNGVDIRPLIAATAAEMRAQAGLAYRPQYLAELERLARKYDVPRGG
jgi:membrane-bound lytic murein transglycosylase B